MSEIKRYRCCGPSDDMFTMYPVEDGLFMYYSVHIAEIEQREKAHAAEIERLVEQSKVREEYIRGLENEVERLKAEYLQLGMTASMSAQHMREQLADKDCENTEYRDEIVRLKEELYTERSNAVSAVMKLQSEFNKATASLLEEIAALMVTRQQTLEAANRVHEQENEIAALKRITSPEYLYETFKRSYDVCKYEGGWAGDFPALDFFIHEVWKRHPEVAALKTVLADFYDLTSPDDFEFLDDETRALCEKLEKEGWV